MFGTSVLSSPTGQQFVSCKDISSYLQSVGGVSTSQQLNGRRGEDIQENRQITENVSIYFFYNVVNYVFLVWFGLFNFFNGVCWICCSMLV